MAKQDEIATICPESSAAWRDWLEENHDKEKSVWVIFHSVKSGKPSLSWSDAVDEALCFGWIDSKRKTLDDGRFIQFYCKRKPNGTWSKINKEKIISLTENRKMHAAGLAVIDKAKQNGSWHLLDEVEELIIPPDLAAAFSAHENAEAYFLSLSKSVRKMLLQWLVLAKRPETRQNRIAEIAGNAAVHLKPKPFR